MLGVAAVCLAMSISNGFESEIRSRLLGTTSHISIFPADQALITNHSEVIRRLESVPGVVAASPFILFKAGISSEDAGDGIIVRGIDKDAESRTSNIEQDIRSGTYTFDAGVDEEGDSLHGIIIGRHLSDRLNVLTGDAVVLYSLRGEDLQKSVRPRVAKFIVTAIFETGMYEFDGELAYISLGAAQRLFRTGDAVTSAHLKLSNIDHAQEVTSVIDSVLEHRYEVIPWQVMHRQLFTWIEIEKILLSLGFLLIVVVAAFSIISTLVMLTMEKRAEIGILKTIGTTPNSIRTIFIIKGLFIGLVGVLLGWALAGILAFLQNRFALIELPGEIYFITALPVLVQPFDFLAAGLVTLLICFIAAIYPADQASRLSVVDVLRQ